MKMAYWHTASSLVWAGDADTRKIDKYAAQAKASWGTTDAYKEYEQNSVGRTKEGGRN